MHDASRNKFGFVLRQLERRISALEAQLGIASPSNPLNNTVRPNVGESKESSYEPRTRTER